ncbi:hypothetical protein BS47DRAFT_414020 [Hydnum rufescens UP504]|uniref:Uncharacterized protein n=1 Tax=Hydnum rufescens UP504 TaxID=1448309 RepID=A0A9P6BCM2_9AGAM|nr:hypothetical protein BS47DRAFT_414020 [Hydnum rufescens UP504]
MFSVDTGITLVQCEVVRLTWTEGVPPYNVTVLDGQTVIESVASRANSLGYMVTPGPGSQLSFVLIDSTGTTSAGGPFLVVAGSDVCSTTQSSSSTSSSLSSSWSPSPSPHSLSAVKPVPRGGMCPLPAR